MSASHAALERLITGGDPGDDEPDDADGARGFSRNPFGLSRHDDSDDEAEECVAPSLLAPVAFPLSFLH
jgi:hypothetical protein